VEARLLARRSAVSISMLSTLPMDTITTFEAVFFNVSDRLDAVDWIHASALGSLESLTPPAEQVDSFVRHLAYYGGETVAELVLQAIPRLLLAPCGRGAGSSRNGPDDRLTGQLRALFIAMTDPIAACRAAATADFSADTPCAHSATLDSVFGSLFDKTFDFALEKFVVEPGATPSDPSDASRPCQIGEAA
jgi:hypothetical protein